MTTTIPAKPICLPPAALNGGPLATAPPKVGDWIWQPKIDDRRVIIHAPTRTVWNQYGLLSVAMSQPGKFGAALCEIYRAQQRCFPTYQWLDAGLMEYRHDLMRGCIVIFDLVQATDYWCRRDHLTVAAAFPVLPNDMALALSQAGGQIRDKVYLVNHFEGVRSNAEALMLQAWLQDQNERIGHKFYEGLVAKNVRAAYPFYQSPKTVTPAWIKHRFDQ